VHSRTYSKENFFDFSAGYSFSVIADAHLQPLSHHADSTCFAKPELLGHRSFMSGSLSLLNFVLPVIAYRLFQKLTSGLQYFAGKRFIRYRAREPDCADQCAIG
jgi:hypothetical protein